MNDTRGLASSFLNCHRWGLSARHHLLHQIGGHLKIQLVVLATVVTLPACGGCPHQYRRTVHAGVRDIFSCEIRQSRCNRLLRGCKQLNACRVFCEQWWHYMSIAIGRDIYYTETNSRSFSDLECASCLFRSTPFRTDAIRSAS